MSGREEGKRDRGIRLRRELRQITDELNELDERRAALLQIIAGYEALLNALDATTPVSDDTEPGVTPEGGEPNAESD